MIHLMGENMKPIVNVDVPMPKKMLNALTLFETYCVASNISQVTEIDVQTFLTKRCGNPLASQFKTTYLYQ